MPKRATVRPTAPGRYWETRLRSKDFRRALTDLVVRELKSLARQRVGDVLDADRIRAMIREWDTRLIDREIVAELVLASSDRAGARLHGREQSLLDLLDRGLVADLDAALASELEPSPSAEEFIADLMDKDLVRGLFTDVIFTALVSFYQKVNPLFGALATRALEEQIKGFIRLFMPMLQAQATAFALDRRNQRIVRDFARSVVRQLLEVPLGRYPTLASSADRERTEALIRKAVTNAKLGALTRRATLAAWDDLFATIRDRRVGDLVRLSAQADWLAERCVEAILPALARPQVLRFVAAELALAASQRQR
jgi:hypothetical protein